MIVILVGAMVVASIHTVWAGAINSVHSDDQDKIVTTDYSSANIQLNKGAELGHFQLGSTVIILFPKDKVSWSETISSDSPIKFGELIGTTAIKGSNSK